MRRPPWTTSPRRPGVTKPLLYQHFESKRALYLELMDVFPASVTRIIAATASADGPRQEVERGFAAYFELMVENEAGLPPALWS